MFELMNYGGGLGDWSHSRGNGDGGALISTVCIVLCIWSANTKQYLHTFFHRHVSTRGHVFLASISSEPSP